MTDNIYTPFTYHIAWTNIDKHYYGVRYAEGCQPSDLWSSYFTSSKLVFDYRQQYGEPDVIEIRRTFDDADSAVAWEHKVLRRLNVLESDKWLNQCIGDARWSLKEHTLETKAKISAAKKGKSAANKGKKRSPETRAKISGALKGKNHPMYGKKHSPESIAKMTGPRNPMYGKTHTLEIRAKISVANKGENNPNYGKSPHNKGKSTSPETKAKQSAANKGKTKSLETRAKMSAARKGTNNPNYGKSPSSETRAKMSAAKKGNQNKKGKKRSPEARANFFLQTKQLLPNPL